MPQTQLSVLKGQMFVTEETVVNTYEIQSAAEGFLAENIVYTLDSEMIPQNLIRGDFVPAPEIVGRASVTIAFRVPVHGSGAAGTAPEYDLALKGCGLTVTNAPATSDIYTITNNRAAAGGDPAQSYSVTFLEDGNAYKLSGGFGNVVFTGEAGMPGYFDFTFTGAYVATAADALETVTYDNAIAPAFMGGTVAGAGMTLTGVDNFIFDLGNNVVLQNDINSAFGYYGSRITTKQPRGSFETEIPIFGTYDFYGAWSGNAGVATLGTGTIGGTAGNIYALALAGQINIGPPEQLDVDGIRKARIPYQVYGQTADAIGGLVTLTYT